MIGLKKPTPEPVWRPVVGAFAAGALLVATTVAVAQGVSGGLRGPTITPGSPIGRLLTAMQQIGLTACAPVFAQGANFLFEDGQVQFIVQPLGRDTNRWPTVVTSEGVHGAKPQTRLSTLIVAPAGTCSGMYQQVIYWPESCASVKARVFGDFKGEHALLQNVRVSEASPALQLFLMPAGPGGCVSIKKELIA